MEIAKNTMGSRLTLDKAKQMMEKSGGSLDLRGTQITSLPDNLTVGGSLDLRGTQITSLPDNLTVGGWLDLSGTQITSLPDNLTVGGWLDLRGTQITSLPDNLTVGGSLDLSGTQITSLPDNLTVGGWLNLSGTQITSLPDNLTVGGGLDLRGTQIRDKRKRQWKVKRLNDGEYKPGKYLYADGILTHIKSTKNVSEYTLYIGKIKGRNVVGDGKNYAHCSNFRDGIADLKFKEAADRGADQFLGMDMDKKIPLEDCKTMYRIITGACRQGTEAFAESLHSAGKLQDSYTIREMIAVTKGQYNAESFARFWEE